MAACVEHGEAPRSDPLIGVWENLDVPRGQIGEWRVQMLSGVRKIRIQGNGRFATDKGLSGVWTKEGNGRLTLARHDGRLTLSYYVDAFEARYLLTLKLLKADCFDFLESGSSTEQKERFLAEVRNLSHVAEHEALLTWKFTRLTAGD